MRITAFIAFSWGCLVAGLAWGPRGAAAQPKHGISLYGDMRYPADFKHFDYADPKAPKGGTVRLPGLGSSFNSLNGFIRKGNAPSGLLPIDPYIYDRLTARSLDEPSTRYGLLAKTIELSPDRLWIEFVLRPEARFHDGTPVTADDVVYTFNLFKTKADPTIQVQLARIVRVEKRGPLTVRFIMPDANDRQLPLVPADMIVLPKHYWEKRDFERATLERPLGSGPYRVGRVDPGRSIEYERVPDYWARNLPVNVGRFNFDRIRYEMFMDNDVRVEAIKGDLIDGGIETVSKTWARGYDFPAVARGHVTREILTTESPAAGRAIIFNTRLPKFQDIRVRKALAYAYDREWTNRTLADGFYESAHSYFEGSELAQRGAPSPAELALLEPFRAALPKELFERPFSIPSTSGMGRNRENLKVAAQLLREAGYVIEDGKLVHEKTKEPFTFEFILDAQARVRFTLHYADALRQLGIETKMRVLDSAELTQRRRKLDFDAIYVTRLMNNTPSYELRSYFASGTALQPNTFNYAGIRSKAVDAMLMHALRANTHAEFVTACRALDRVLTWGYYGVDIGVMPGAPYVLWNRFARPAIAPRFVPGFPHVWWYDNEKAAKIKAGIPIPVRPPETEPQARREPLSH